MNEFESKTLRLRLVEENDADSILSLRLDEGYNAFLSTVGSKHRGSGSKNTSAPSKLKISTTSSLNVTMVLLVAPFECMTYEKILFVGEAGF